MDTSQGLGPSPMDLDFTLSTLQEWQQLEREHRELKQQIHHWRTAPTRDHNFLFCVNDHPQNESRNRYTDVKPLEHSRVKLQRCESDYINGNWISGIHSQPPHSYIATQAPLPSTFGDFWQAVWQEHSLIIIMLTQLEEQGMKKADRYWPPTPHPMICEKFHISLVSEHTTGEFVTREFKLKKLDTNETRIINHIQCIWPDMGVPSNSSMIGILGHIKQLNDTFDHTTNHPLIVHCSAGLGRAGTFILIHTMVNYVKESKKDFTELDFVSVLQKLRMQRHGMVQTWDQYRFAKNFVFYYISAILVHQSAVPEIPPSPSQIKRKRNSVQQEGEVFKRTKVDSASADSSCTSVENEL